uniref:Retrovirus-related Pol polyprotein from transposon TNT 1-94-like beta-barrel domain-containing protein n=1 Tax=Lactuca sativa TaxID=4236 RepID=A0A9R1VTU4_LACSA|nr:hypothetical protein LSAT_V11C400201830 [Lactuca sativa]
MIHKGQISKKKTGNNIGMGKGKASKKGMDKSKGPGSLLLPTELLTPSLMLTLIAFTSTKRDTGYIISGTNICNDFQRLNNVRELRDGDLELHVSNGTQVVVKAIGQYQLLLANGVSLVLKNCCYIPSITRNIISTSRLYENIYVFKDNVFYFKTSPNSGIYKINLNGSYQKDN